MKVQVLLEIEFNEIAPGIELEVVDNWPTLEESLNNPQAGYRVKILGTRRIGIATILTSVKRTSDVRIFQKAPIVWGGDPEL